ncbi:invasion associated locus B family protein [Novispirillum itersonii]|uniref:invasion associated locus B family protein n=1 Tax=Novispirillum itersonii TaxID=189 RepID=UPI00037ACEC5|nr:invasion associated locus B family protein [Novispirillum itersonii]
MPPMFRSLLRSGALCALMALSIAPEGHAAETKTLGVFGSWTAYSFTENGKQVCYMAARPSKADGNFASRGDIYALITHRPGQKSLNVFSIVAGYAYSMDSEDLVQVSIGKRIFKLFTQGERAWTHDDKADQALSDAIRKGGADMIVRGKSMRNAETVDTYSLIGAPKALEAIDSACGVKPTGS